MAMALDRHETVHQIFHWAVCRVRLGIKAARAYSNPVAPGCMVQEGTHSNEASAREAARLFHVAAQNSIRELIAERHP